MHKSQSLFNLTTTLHVSGITITHLQEQKTTVTTASGNRYTVIDLVKFSDKEYRQTRLKLQLLNNVYSAENAKTCRAVIRLNKLRDLCIQLELYTRILLRCTDP